MSTKTCKFGGDCKFNHPFWVPEGGLTDWKEVLPVYPKEAFSERSGKPDYPHDLTTEECKFGPQCEVNHPMVKKDTVDDADGSTSSERPYVQNCWIYIFTGKCPFGENCEYLHPKDFKLPALPDPTRTNMMELAVKDKEAAVQDLQPEKQPLVSVIPAVLHNSKGFPIRQGVDDCQVYLSTGSCKFGANCLFNHPETNFINPSPAVDLKNATIKLAVTNPPSGPSNFATTLLPNINICLTSATFGEGSNNYPQKPGKILCDVYMKNGQCKFGDRCKFHHPIDRSTPTSQMNQTREPDVDPYPAGLPRREGTTFCPYYMKTGVCKFGDACWFDHPPPEELIAMVKMQESVGGSVNAATKEQQ